MQLLGPVFSVWGLLVAVVLTSVGWYWALRRHQHSPDLEMTVKTLLPLLAAVTALFSYGAQAVSSDSQQRYFERHLNALTKQIAVVYEQNDLMRQRINALHEQNSIMRAEYQGLLTFHAEHDDNWVVTLRKADGAPFAISGLRLIPNYQLDRTEGPVDGTAVPVEPDYIVSERAFQISDALQLVCDFAEPSLCKGETRLRMLTLEFFHDGERYRVVANPR